MREYVNNDGASYEPLLADLETAGATDYQIQSYKGHIADADHDQYAHKFYSVRLKADQDVTIPIQIRWFEQLAVITQIGGADTTVYTTGTDDNTVERLTVDLTRGVNDLHILTYTAVTDQRLEITLDLTSIHSSITPVGGVAKTASAQIDNPDGITDTLITLIDVDAVDYPSGITVTGCSIKTRAASTYSVAFMNYSDPTGSTSATIETVATSASTEASDDGTIDSPSIAVGNIVLAKLPATDVNSVFVKVRYTVD
jgi:hypothetical protein